MDNDQDKINKVLISIKNKKYLKNYQLGISPQEFYLLIMRMADKELLYNVPDPESKDGAIVSFEIEGALLTERGENECNIALEGKNMKNDVFIVHGHDNALKNEVARTIEKWGLSVTILHEKANGDAPLIIQKFEKYASEAGFAVILLTPDDRGKSKEERKYQDRARQNVIFEWGYFLGRFGAGKVCAIHNKDIEMPSDLGGVLYIPYDEYGGWKNDLAQELKEAGFSIKM